MIDWLLHFRFDFLHCKVTKVLGIYIYLCNCFASVYKKLISYIQVTVIK